MADACRGTINLDDCTDKNEIRHTTTAKNERGLTVARVIQKRHDERFQAPQAFHQDVRGLKPEILSGHLVVYVLLLFFLCHSLHSTSHLHVALRTLNRLPTNKERW